jgi:hypothetical protein
MQAVGKVARFQVAPNETHVLAVKRIFIYLKGTTKFGLWYPKVNELTMVAYANAYWVGIFDDKKRTRRETFYLSDCLVSWLSNTQSSISLSIAEEESITTTTCCTQFL